MNEEEPCYEEITLKFKLPMAAHEATMAMKAQDYAAALYDIHSKCRNVWKYKEDASESEINFAEEIAEMVRDTGVLEEYR